MLDWHIRGENRDFAVHFTNTPEGKKAEREFYEKYYPPETGYFRAFYERTDTFEYFEYSPEKNNEKMVRIIIREKNNP